MHPMSASPMFALILMLLESLETKADIPVHLEVSSSEVLHYANSSVSMMKNNK